MKERYVNPFTDFGFKKLFGDEPNKDLLIDFLNQLLIGREQIADLTFRKTDHLGRAEVDRRAVFDLYCENERGERFIVELQKSKQRFFKDRTLFYSTFPIAEQAERGEWNFELKAVYTVAILDFTFEDDDREKTLVHDAEIGRRVVVPVQLMETDRHRVFYDKLLFIYLQMPNFQKTEAQLETRFDKWLYVLKNLPRLTDRPAKLQERVFERLFNLAELAKFSPPEREAYEDSLKHYRDLKNVIDTARDDAFDKGLAEGVKLGAWLAQARLVLRLRKQGMSPEAIAPLVELSTTELARILAAPLTDGEATDEHLKALYTTTQS